MKKKGFTVVELLVVVAIIVTLMAILLPNLAAALERARQTQCAANLRSIGQSIKVYSSGNRGRWPSVFNDESTEWGEAWDDENGLISDFQDTVDVAEELEPFTCNLSCWWILIRKGMSKPGVFICPSSDQEPDQELLEPEAVWSFRDLKHCSYSYQNQIGRGTTDSADADLIVAADLNPLRLDMQMEESHRREDKERERFWWNSPNHDWEGQNCLYADGHMEWQSTPFCGIGGNNIWVATVYDKDETPPWPVPDDEEETSYDSQSPKDNKKDTFLVP